MSNLLIVPVLISPEYFTKLTLFDNYKNGVILKLEIYKKMNDIIELVVRYYSSVVIAVLLAMFTRAHYYRVLKREYSKNREGSLFESWMIAKIWLCIGFMAMALLGAFAQWFVFKTNYGGVGSIEWESLVWSKRMYVLMLIHFLYASTWICIMLASILFSIKTLFSTKKRALSE